MAKKNFEELQVEHSELCAQAYDLGIEVPADLTTDFDTQEVGDAVVTRLRKMIALYFSGVDDKDRNLASDAEPAQDVKKRAKAQKAKDAKKPKAGESKMTKSTKKVAKTKKTAAKKTVVKKAAAKKAVVKKNGNGGKKKVGKSARIIEMLRRKGGATREQVLKFAEWPSVSIQALAKHAGVKLKVDDSKRPFTYSV